MRLLRARFADIHSASSTTVPYERTVRPTHWQIHFLRVGIRNLNQTLSPTPYVINTLNDVHGGHIIVVYLEFLSGARNVEEASSSSLSCRSWQKQSYPISIRIQYRLCGKRIHWFTEWRRIYIALWFFRWTRKGIITANTNQNIEKNKKTKNRRRTNNGRQMNVCVCVLVHHWME